jgi:UDP-N-acetylglucosamine--N-acetylmuramyl-(pentapeptide) pyrophosphoryl-undecaprenol N-acetylglucosamine transferase
LNARHSHVDTLWVGSESGMEAELVGREGVRFASIPAAGLHGVGLRSLPRNAAQLVRGFVASRRLLHEFHPDVLFFTGGYLAGPMALAGKAIPTVLYVPDIEPGLALKTLARFADRICVTSARTQKYLRQSVAVTGYPVRAELAQWTKQRARLTLGLEEDLPVLLVAGGSKGARSINQALVAQLPALLEVTQVVHLTGQGESETVAAATAHLTQQQQRRYHRHAFLHEDMGAALAAADFAVMRSGASVLGELPLFGLPAILVPYPHAWRYQWINARYLAEQNAAVVIEDAALRGKLLSTVQSLLREPAKRTAMHDAMRSLAHPEAANLLAGQLLELGGHRA